MPSTFKAALALLVAIHTTARAQRAEVQLSAPVWQAVEEFTSVGSVRELKDGSLLVADRGENRVVRLSADGRSATSIVRIGAGPGEVRTVGWLVALGEDETLLTDAFSGRWLRFAASQVVATVSESNALNQTLRADLWGASSRGWLLGTVPYSAPGRGPVLRESADSLLLLRAHVNDSGSIDTIGRLKGRGGGVRVEPGRDGQPGRIVVGQPLSAEDRAIMASDGWVAVVTVAPYRVSWLSTEGRWTQGPIYDSLATRISASSRCILEVRRSGSQNPERCAQTEGPVQVAPLFLPPTAALSAPPLVLDTAGRLWVARVGSARPNTTMYEVFDRSGRLVSRVYLGQSEYLVGFGTRGAYVVQSDDDGVQRVSSRALR